MADTSFAVLAHPERMSEAHMMVIRVKRMVQIVQQSRGSAHPALIPIYSKL